ncbi:ferredoxin [Streptomyces sp. NPDC001443]
MKITVNTRLCSGHARCAATAPDLYRLDDNGYALPVEAGVPADLEQQAREGARACPEHAITIE